MAARKRTKSQRERDLVITAEMYIAGKTQAAIAKKVGVSRPQITKDLAEIQRYWRKTTTLLIDDHKAIQLAKLDRLEAECWDAWEASQQPSTVKEARDTKAGQYPGRSAMTREVSSAGDPRFLEAIGRCIERRCKILGLDSPTKAHLLVDDMSTVFDDKEVRKIAAQILGTARDN
jgi:hypothetical protein